MIVLGLTGSIAMGKSTTAQMLRNMGIPVHDSDVAVHAALGPNGVAVDAVRALFPAAYDGASNAINRQTLGQIVFGDTAQKSALENILHPVVREMQQQFLLGCKAKGSEIVVLDIPLLYETGAESRVDKVIVASCPSFLQRLRAMNRPGMTEAKFQAILAAQLPDAEKRKRADFIVQTGLGRAHAQAALHKIIASLQTRQSHDPHSNDLPPRP
jgi:dephospho-CoA kinase